MEEENWKKKKKEIKSSQLQEHAWGGGTLENKSKPGEFKKFSKNRKNKKILIGSIVGLILLIGGITLYRTFALYEEKKEFNVLQGRIPSFYKSWDFYENKENVFEIPYSGSYKLEVWGASGGSASGSRTGYGAYATGEIFLEKGVNLYIHVGGQGGKYGGGYNGGGNGRNATAWTDGKHEAWGYGGGGATHIATKSGLLSTLSNSVTDILIVAAGGGGSGGVNPAGYGGSGGGVKGANGYCPVSYGCYIGSGAPQTASGYPFGRGSNQSETAAISSDPYGGAGGGAGFYGGTASRRGNLGAGGGSSYIGNTLLSKKVMYCYECEESEEETTKTISVLNVSNEPMSEIAKIGNGYAKITYMG